ncbi:nadh-cytochrome b5 reductase [Diplodia corticola]|uniref:Nadh-cytochrome b5 reductase n=1 Tax=Diplodia corticola TaxID=236234 RepID=A0A1J9R0F1_9PEZI|nr:nadh-cytochrome b5 reductase [Diplodia corticola]OJD34073.1 nadh-cytochrome b5 reductase [Diplodia corticola]
MSQILRPLRANLGTVAALGAGATLIYAFAKPKPATVFGGFSPQYLRLEAVEQLNHNTKLLRFAFPNPDDLSGLPLTSSILTLAKPTTSNRLLPTLRPYTPLTTPSTRGHLDLLVKLYPGGPHSTHLHSLHPGDRLFFLNPLPNHPWQPGRYTRIACIAGGAGVTPMLQLVRGIVEGKEKTEVDVVVGVREGRDVVMRREWGEVVERAGGRVRVWWVVGRGDGEEGDREGCVTAGLLRELGVDGGEEGGGGGQEMVFVCGPPGMEEMLVGKKGGGGGGGVLAELGFGKERVHRF